MYYKKEGYYIMKSNDDYLNYLYSTLDITDVAVRDHIINDILKTFSAYITNYDNDYLYNYKFIVSHIDDFIKTWNKSIRIVSDSERLKDILRSNENIATFCKSISQNPEMKLSILINDAIEISTSSTIGILFIKREKPLSKKSISYKEEIDIHIKLVIGTVEYRKDFTKVIIKELHNDTKASNNISIITIIESLIKEFFYYIISLNDLSNMIEVLKLIDYKQNNIEDICFQFEDFLEFYPFRESESLSTPYIFKFQENNDLKNFKIENIFVSCNSKNIKTKLNINSNYIEQLNNILNSKEVKP